jgi:heme/copper-type cytochrome/quinol oxidase subunit 1
MLRTTDAKQLGIMYLTTAFAFFMIGGLVALLMRAELAHPGMQMLSPEQYNHHYMLFGTIVFAVLAGIYFWFPQIVGWMLDDRLGKVRFWLTFIGFHHVPGAALPRRGGYARPLRRLPARRRLHVAQHVLDAWLVHPERLDAAVPLQLLEVLTRRSTRHRRRHRHRRSRHQLRGQTRTADQP